MASGIEGNLPHFIPQDEDFSDERYYEEIVFEDAQVPTRFNWHDTFNAIIWMLFPRTKRLLNQLHMQDIQQSGKVTRTKRRDAITLLDECGVIIPYVNEADIQALRQHQWQQIFVTQRRDWDSRIGAFMFGHANYEMLQNPYIGLTGKAFGVKVEADFFQLSLAQQYQTLDKHLLQLISLQDALADNSMLSPLPLLGVPGWYQQNREPDFYLNTDYFRPKRVKK